MVRFLLVGLMGCLVSFLGQLPLGSTSFAATQLKLQEGSKSAWPFSFGVALVEIIYLRISLAFIDKVFAHPQLFRILGWVTVFLFLGLGLYIFIKTSGKSDEYKGPLFDNKRNRFVLGMTLSGINPAQIPFWLLWSTYLLNAKLLKPTVNEYNYFTIGAGIGTIAGLAVYIYAGNYLVKKFHINNNMLNKIMGGIFIFAAVLQFLRLITNIIG